MTPDRLRAFIAELQPTVAALTLRNRIINLDEAMRVMVPGLDLPYLRRARYRLKARARPVRNKRSQMVSTQELVKLGFELMERAEHGDVQRDVFRASLYRDGLMILILACRPIRRSNVAAMQIGRHLVRRGDAYVLCFDAAEMKGQRELEQPLDAALTPLIERYLDHYRPSKRKKLSNF